MIHEFAVAFEAAKVHAREQFPKESCGFIVEGAYIACDNLADDPSKHVEGDRECACQLCSFEISGALYRKYADRLQMVVHSHPDGPFYPSKTDMMMQAQMDVAWAIIALDEERIADPLIWGGSTPTVPILGRQFMHGTSDCYALIRDTYKLGKDVLAEQGIEWPFEPIALPDFPRDDAWWAEDEDLYIDNFAKAGFVRVDSPQPGDVFLMKIGNAETNPKSRINHGGLLLADSQIMHHLPTRLSRREPAGLWARQVELWLRYKGADADA